jgi:uncharacterized protein (TIGR02300 family)
MSPDNRYSPAAISFRNRSSGGFDLAKIEWGIKRICQACGALFYDLNKDPITCPKCDVGFDPEAVLKSRRTRTAIPENIKPKTSETEAVDEEETIDDAEVELEDEDEDDVDADVVLPEVDADEEVVVVSNDEDVLDDQSSLDDEEDEELLKVEEE